VPMKLIRRSGWGARPPLGRPPIDPKALRGLAIHYSASDADEQRDHARCAARVQGMQRYHMDENGWVDLAYNWVSCLHGYVFEGRGGAVRSAANGTKDANDRYLAVCFLGNDTPARDDVTHEGRQALTEVIAEFRRRYPRARELRPHSYFFATLCPGDELRAFIRSQLAKGRKERR
jgi:N-acetylmuramoyl-L-alanine amidase